MLTALSLRSVDFSEAAQTATAGLITLVPEGLVLLMSVTFAVAAVRLARAEHARPADGATEALAAVDTICVDKTGTLTDGSLELIEVVAPPTPPAREGAERALGRFAASAGERNRTLETIAEAFPAEAAPVIDEVPFSSKWKWSGLTLNGEGARRAYVIGAPDVLIGAGAMTPARRPRGGAREQTAAGRRVIAFGEAPAGLPRDPAVEPPPRLEPRALVVLEETMRPDARGDDRVHARAGGRPEADLRRRARDRHRGRPRARRAAGGRRRRGAAAARRPRGARPRRRGEHDLLPDHARIRRRRWSAPSRTRAGSRR